jgi:hypothetical protein
MNDCADCKGLTRLALIERSLNCKMREFYEPREIYFCPIQIAWLLQNIQILKLHKWAPEQYTKFRRRRRPGSNAYFVTPTDFVAELTRRLEHCGKDGLLPLLYFGYDFPLEELSNYHRLTPKGIRYHIEVILWRISGWNFYNDRPYRWDNHHRDYQNWKSQHRGMSIIP